jgi:hypothetical protein
MYDNNAYKANEEASFASKSTLGTLKDPLQGPSSENTPTTRNTAKSPLTSSSSSDTGSTVFSADTAATMQRIKDPVSSEEELSISPKMEARMTAAMHQSVRGMDVDSGKEETPPRYSRTGRSFSQTGTSDTSPTKAALFWTNNKIRQSTQRMELEGDTLETPPRKPPKKNRTQLLHNDTGDPRGRTRAEDSNRNPATINLESDEDSLDSDIAPLIEANIKFVCTGDEATWPRQISHNKCQQLLQHSILLDHFLQDWLKSVAFPKETDPFQIPDTNHIKRTILRVINSLMGQEELPLEALCTLLQKATLAQLEADYPPTISTVSQGTTGPSTDEGTGGER